MATWPNTLPQQFNRKDYQETDPNLVVLFQPDFGEPIARQRGTANMAPMSGTMKMTTAQKVIHQAFYKANCATAITFPDPNGGSAIQVKYLAPAAYKPIGGGFWEVTLKFGVKP